MKRDDLEDSRQPELIALLTVMLTLSVMFVLLRISARVLSKAHKFGLDDFFAVMSLPFVVAEVGVTYWGISLGLGRHASSLPPEDILRSSKTIFMEVFLYCTAISLPKLSVLFFYYRIFRKTNRWFYHTLWVLGALAVAWLAMTWLANMFQCSPVEKAWSPLVEGHCFPRWNWYLGAAIISTTIDFAILIIPLPLLWSLQASRSRKVSIIGIFVCGYCVPIVSIARLVSLVKAGTDLGTDFSGSDVTFFELTSCEGPISIISVCLPTIFSMTRRIRKEGLRTVIKTKDNPKDVERGSIRIPHNHQFIRMETYADLAGACSREEA